MAQSSGISMFKPIECPCGKRNFTELEHRRLMCDSCGSIYMSPKEAEPAPLPKPEPQPAALLPDPKDNEVPLNVVRDVDITFGKDVPEEAKEEITLTLCEYSHTTPKSAWGRAGGPAFKVFCNKANIEVQVQRSCITFSKTRDGFFVYIPKKPHEVSYRSVPLR
jgi:hypothetical protein